jgi:hypothetical protein
MTLIEAMKLGDAVHEDCQLRLRGGVPEVLPLGGETGGWQPVPAEEVELIPEDGWMEDATLAFLEPDFPEYAPARWNNVTFVDFHFGRQADGNMTKAGFDACHAYARHFVATGGRDLRLEREHPELADDFAQIRTDEEMLEFHLLDAHKPRPEELPGAVLPFTGIRPIPETDHYLQLIDLKLNADGSYSPAFNPAAVTCEEALETIGDLCDPVRSVRILRIAEGRYAPGVVVIENGGKGEVYAVFKEYGDAMDLVSERTPEKPRGRRSRRVR